jgi:hypothetical protein
VTRDDRAARVTTPAPRAGADGAGGDGSGRGAALGVGLVPQGMGQRGVCLLPSGQARPGPRRRTSAPPRTATHAWRWGGARSSASAGRSTYLGLKHGGRLTTAWIALSPSTPESGCLRVLPGAGAACTSGPATMPSQRAVTSREATEGGRGLLTSKVPHAARRVARGRAAGACAHGGPQQPALEGSDGFGGGGAGRGSGGPGACTRLSDSKRHRIPCATFVH